MQKISVTLSLNSSDGINPRAIFRYISIYSRISLITTTQSKRNDANERAIGSKRTSRIGLTSVTASSGRAGTEHVRGQSRIILTVTGIPVSCVNFHLLQLFRKISSRRQSSPTGYYSWSSSRHWICYYGDGLYIWIEYKRFCNLKFHTKWESLCTAK
jgi:hypothetical protein